MYTITWNHLLEISLNVGYVNMDVRLTHWCLSKDIFVQNCKNMEHDVING
jgi:hypothetical protein